MTDEKIIRAAALGFFDGVHRGHQALMHAAIKRAKEMGALSCAVTFDTHPLLRIRGKQVPLLVPDLKRRAVSIIKYGGLDEVIMLPFTDSLMRMHYEEFIGELLIKKYNVRHVIMGENYTCGFKGLGNPSNIAPLCDRLGITYDVIDEVRVDGRTVSSTLIRELVAREDYAEAERLLGHELEED